MKRQLTWLDAKALYELDIKTLQTILGYDYAMDVNSVVEHTKLVTKSLNELAKQIETAALARINQFKADSK